MPLPPASSRPACPRKRRKMVTEDLIPCANPKPGMNLRKKVGEITAQDGTKFTVPVANNYATAPKLPAMDARE
jgi:hypothetical protein